MRTIVSAAVVSAAYAAKNKLQDKAQAQWMDCEDPLDCIMDTAWDIEDAAKELQYLRDGAQEPEEDLYIAANGNIYDNNYSSFYDAYYHDYYCGEENYYYDAYYGDYRDETYGYTEDNYGFSDDSYYDWSYGDYYDGWTGDKYNDWYGDSYNTTGADGIEEHS